MEAQGATRTIIAAMSRVDRATRKALRDKERKTRGAQRPCSAPEAAAKYEALFEQLTRLHCVKYQRVDWKAVAAAGMVEPAVRQNALEQKARRALATYQPGVIDGLFGLGKDRRRALAEKVLEAAKKDAELYAQAKRNADLHNLDVSLAAGVLALDIDAIEQALKAHVPVKALARSVEGLCVQMQTPGRLVVYLDALELDALPDEAVGVSDTGRAVYARITPAQRYEMHLSAVCSASLRVAVEVMAVAPLDLVDVVARTLMPGVDSQGEVAPAIHVKVPHQALKALELRRLEPVSTITALGGRLDWTVERGFAPIGIDDLKLTAAGPPQTAAA